jgi:hypothetical protein
VDWDSASSLRMIGGIVTMIEVVSLLLWLTVLGTSIWATADAYELRRRGLDMEHPAKVFIACVAFWIVIFPWYIVKRNRVLTTSTK